MTGKTFAATVAAAGAIALGAACGGNSDSAPSPTTGGGGGGGSTTAGTTITITITASGVSPKTLTVARGTQVTFLNNDALPHEMKSNPHPGHGDCPEINQVGLLSAGQSKVTATLNTAETCRYHDHQHATQASLQGTIVVQ